MEPRQAKEHSLRAGAVAQVCVAAVAVAGGLGLAIFGDIGLMIGPIVLVFGLIGRTFGNTHAIWLIWIGAARPPERMTFRGGDDWIREFVLCSAKSTPLGAAGPPP